MLDKQAPPIYKTSYNLTLAIIRLVRDCDNDYRMTLGQTLQTRVLLLQIAIYQINEKEDKSSAIQVALNHIFFIKMMLRLFLDINLIKLEVNIALNILSEEVIKQLQGWKNSLKKKS
jgi:hypothetical protein